MAKNKQKKKKKGEKGEMKFKGLFPQGVCL